jgi:hypothetical protein
VPWLVFPQCSLGLRALRPRLGRRLRDLVGDGRDALRRWIDFEDNFARWLRRSFLSEPVADKAEHEVVCLSLRERILGWLEAVVPVPCLASDRVSAVGGAREAFYGSFRRPSVAAEDREDVFDVRVVTSEIGPLAGLCGWGDEFDDLDLSVGSGALDTCVDLAVEADGGTDVDEVLLGRGLVDKDGSSNARRVEAAELNVECAGRECEEYTAARLDRFWIRETDEVSIRTRSK